MNYTQCGSALALPYADGIAQTCVTSPPYYGLRDYGTARWEGGDAGCDHLGRQAARTAKGQPGTGVASNTLRDGVGGVDGECAKCGARRIDAQIGLEQTPAAYVAQIVAAMREVWRVLRDDGTLWLNLGDSYARQAGDDSTKATDGGMKTGRTGKSAQLFKAGNNVPPDGLKPKDLMGIPWRVAFALQDDGWYLRSDIIWAKPNPMPESVTDRPTKAHEYVFLLAKQPRYFYDAEAIKENTDAPPDVRLRSSTFAKAGESGKHHNGNPVVTTIGRNARSVWNIATQPYSGAHFATMPPELARRCILAGTSARGQCPKCGAPWMRQVKTERTNESGSGKSGNPISAASKNGATMQGGGVTSDIRNGPTVRNTTTGWAASCACDAGDPVPQIVLDPFAGSGTTAMVALQNGRRAIGTELNPKYLRLQDDRTQVTMGLGL